MKKPILYLINLFSFSAGSFMLYYLLIEDSIFHLSIADIFNWAKHFAKTGHLLVIAALPIYLGLLIFGAAMFYIYLRSNICPFLLHHVKRWIYLERE